MRGLGFVDTTLNCSHHGPARHVPLVVAGRTPCWGLLADAVVLGVSRRAGVVVHAAKILDGRQGLDGALLGLRNRRRAGRGRGRGAGRQDSLVLELQPAVNAPIPINAAAPATNAMRRVKVTDAMVSPKFEYENVDPGHYTRSRQYGGGMFRAATWASLSDRSHRIR